MKMAYIYGIAGAVAFGIVLRFWHQLRRWLEHRCPEHGLFGIEITHYMEPNVDAPYTLLTGRHCTTYKFFRCKKYGYSCVHCETRRRHISLWALRWKHCFHPSHSRRSHHVDQLFDACDFNMPGRCRAYSSSKTPDARLKRLRASALIIKIPGQKT